MYTPSSLDEADAINNDPLDSTPSGPVIVYGINELQERVNCSLGLGQRSETVVGEPVRLQPLPVIPEIVPVNEIIRGRAK